MALRTLAALSNHGRLRAVDIAELVDSTPAYIAHVMVDLSAPGWIDSAPRRTGGHRLAVDLSTITMLELIEAIEGPTDDGRCVMADGPCPAAETCALHDAWIPARDALVARLSATTLDAVTHHQVIRHQVIHHQDTHHQEVTS
ncbi:MAG: RrF2 family transcriptional regulator [Ilumatobacteraceae bacterium]